MLKGQEQKEDFVFLKCCKENEEMLDQSKRSSSFNNIYFCEGTYLWTNRHYAQGIKIESVRSEEW